MRGSTRTWTVARRAVTTAVAVLAGLTFAVGCGSDKPTDGSSSPDAAAAGPSSTTETTSPGSSPSADPSQTGAPDGGAGGGTGGDPGGGTGGGGGGTGGGGGGGGAQPAGMAPCAIVTNADANQALGTAANKTHESDTECLYEAGGNAVMVSVTEEPYDQEAIDDLAQLAPAVQKIDGVGDAAFKVSLGADTQFHVWTKGKYLALIVTKESGDSEGPGRELLNKVLTRI